MKSASADVSPTADKHQVACPGVRLRSSVPWCANLVDRLVSGIEDVAVYIETARAAVTLRALTPDIAVTYESAMKANAAHLTRHGNYAQEVEKAASEYVTEFQKQWPALAFGIYEMEELVGSVALVPVDPPQYGLGYWLAESACGRGLATTAVEAVARYAEETLAATNIFAGVTHGNDKSRAVLQRAGFQVVAEFEDYTRYHRALP